MRWLGVAALVSLLVIVAATAVIIAGVVVGKSNDCPPGVFVTPSPIGAPGPSGGPR